MCQLLQDLVADGYNEGWKGGLAEGWEGGMAKGKAEGEEAKARTTVWNLEKLGMDSVTIADVVGYDEETVEKWLKEYKDSLS